MKRSFGTLLTATVATVIFCMLIASGFAYAEEALGNVRGRIVDSDGSPVAGTKVVTFLSEDTYTESVTDENGCYALQTYIGRKSLKFKVGLNLLGFTTKTQSKTDIRIGEVDILIGENAESRKKLTVPVFMACLDKYAVYLCDVELDGENARWLPPQYFKLSGMTLSSDIVREGQRLDIEVPVSFPPYQELAGSMRVLIHGDLFKGGSTKAFDDGDAADKVRGDGIYTASYTVPEKGPFGFFVLKGEVQMPPLSAVFEPGNSWPLMMTVIDTSEAGGRIERLTTVYSLGGVETGMSAEWYYYDDDDDHNEWINALNTYQRNATEQHWYSLYARSKLADTSASVFACRGMVEFRAVSALRRMIGYYEAGDYEQARAKLDEARKLAPDYESLPLWEARLKQAQGDTGGAVEILENSLSTKKQKGLSIVLAELYREEDRPQQAFEAYINAYNESYDPVILLALSDYLYELKEYEAAQNGYDLLKYYAESIPYNYGFLMHGGYDFNRRYFDTSKAAEEWLFREYAPPSDVWTKALFEDAYIMGSVCGWKEKLTTDDWSRLSQDSLKKYSVMLRLAGDLQTASDVSLFIDGDEGALEQGIVSLEKAVTEGSDENGEIVRDGAELKRAMENFTAVAADDSENADAHYLSALALFMQGKNEAALEYALMAIELDPDNQELRFLTARIYEALELYEDSIPHWQWFVDEAPDGTAKILAGEHLLDLKAALGTAM